MTLLDAPDLLTVAEAAAIARVGRNQMYQAVTRGDVYACVIGRSVRIPKVALERWLLGPYAGIERTAGGSPSPAVHKEVAGVRSTDARPTSS